MTRPTIRYFDENDVQIDREMNDAEFAQYEIDQTTWKAIEAQIAAADQLAAQVEAQRLIDRQAGIDALVKLGLTKPQAEAIADGTH